MCGGEGRPETPPDCDRAHHPEENQSHAEPDPRDPEGIQVPVRMQPLWLRGKRAGATASPSNARLQLCIVPLRARLRVPRRLRLLTTWLPRPPALPTVPPEAKSNASGAGAGPSVASPSARNKQPRKGPIQAYAAAPIWLYARAQFSSEGEASTSGALA